MVRGKNEYSKTSVRTGNDINFFSLEALLRRDETERWSTWQGYKTRTQRLSVPKFGRRFPTFDATRTLVSSSKVKVTKPINAHTHRAPYLPNSKAYELQTWCAYGGRRASATGAMTSTVARSRNHSEPSWPNAVPVSLESSGGIRYRPNRRTRRPHFLVLLLLLLL